MNTDQLAVIYFLYGLAFFSMGLAILLEIGQCPDPRLQHALRPLAVFGFLHGFHEWLEMFDLLGIQPFGEAYVTFWAGISLGLLVFSFLALAGFGSALLFEKTPGRHYDLIPPLILATIWAIGIFFIKGSYPPVQLINVTDVWTRYSLAIPAALLASAGLIVQQREFRRVGMKRFSRDCLWAAVAFAWYGLVGQVFTHASPFYPSNIINDSLFYELFRIPIQLVRAGAAVLAAIFVIRFLRSFEVEIQRRIAALQAAQLDEAKQRETLRGELLRQIVAAQEAERQRIARELHDETGQSLTAIGLGLRSVSTSLNQDSEKSNQKLRQLEGLVAGSLTELQHIIADLRPSHLDDLGLTAAIRWYITEIQNRTNLKINFEIIGEEYELPTEVRTALFRVAQEAVTNTVRHAEATDAKVQLEYEPAAIKVTIADNGRGLTRITLGRWAKSPGDWKECVNEPFYWGDNSS